MKEDGEPESFVYFIQAGRKGPIKIGVAKDPSARFFDIQAACPLKLKIIGVMPGKRCLEADLHRRFRPQRLRGEWFHPSDELILFARQHPYVHKGRMKTIYIDASVYRLVKKAAIAQGLTMTEYIQSVLAVQAGKDAAKLNVSKNGK